MSATKQNPGHANVKAGAPRRILFVEANQDRSVGGSHQALFDLVIRLDRDRFVPVVVFYQDNPFAERLRRLGFETLSIEDHRARERSTYASSGVLGKALEKVRVVRRRAALIRQLRVDLVHVINSPRVTCDDWLPACKLTGIPCFASEMMLDSMVETGPVRRWLVRRFDRILPVSGHQEMMLRDMGVRPDRNILIHLGVDAEALRASVTRSREGLRHELGATADTVLMVMVGNIRYWKGQHVVVEAMGLLSPEIRARVRLVFAGVGDPEDPDYERGLKERVMALDLAESVEFLGFRRDAPDLFHAADVAIHASVGPEPFGLVVLEAMALGATVVAAGEGGPAEMLTPESGMVYDPGNSAELARSLSYLIHNREQRLTMSEAARKRADQFSVDDNAAKIQFLYRQVLGG
jgi:glycosyltransferase involved in cell wall biosynthesis